MKAAPFLSKFVQQLKPAAGQAALGSGLSALYGLVGGGPQAALAYGTGDFLLNVPAIALARRFSPGTARRLMQVDKNNKPIIDTKTKKPIIKDVQFTIQHLEILAYNLNIMVVLQELLLVNQMVDF